MWVRLRLWDMMAAFELLLFLHHGRDWYIVSACGILGCEDTDASDTWLRDLKPWATFDFSALGSIILIAKSTWINIRKSRVSCGFGKLCLAASACWSQSVILLLLYCASCSLTGKQWLTRYFLLIMLVCFAEVCFIRDPNVVDECEAREDLGGAIVWFLRREAMHVHSSLFHEASLGAQID